MKTPRIVSLRSSALAALAVVVACVLGACSPTVLPPSGPHPPLAPADVKIYQTQPQEYELLGSIAVPVTAAMKWDEKGDSTLGFEALKAQAAAKGANGVLLMSDINTYDLKVGAGYMGKFYLVPVKSEPRTAMAQAIFVAKE